MRRVCGVLVRAAILLSLLAGCAGAGSPVAEKEVTRVIEKEVTRVTQEVVEVTPTPAPMVFRESPMLAAKVKAGDLPPVQDRLPLEPLVVEGPDGIGTYGGTLYMLDGETKLSKPHRLTDHGLFGYNMAVSAYHADVAKGWSWSDDYTELTIYLRKGLKWSDGVPVTTQDFKWCYDNVLFNEVLRPNGPGYPWVIDGKQTKLVIIDDFTLKYIFPKPLPCIERRSGGSRIQSYGDSSRLGGLLQLEERPVLQCRTVGRES